MVRTFAIYFLCTFFSFFYDLPLSIPGYPGVDLKNVKDQVVCTEFGNVWGRGEGCLGSFRNKLSILLNTPITTERNNKDKKLDAFIKLILLQNIKIEIDKDR